MQIDPNPDYCVRFDHLYYYIRGARKETTTAIVEESGERMKLINYRLARLATVCLIVATRKGMVEAVARGVAICSPKDQFCRAKGRHIAQGRALRAMLDNTTYGYLPWPYADIIPQPEAARFKGAIGPILQEFEQDIIQRSLRAKLAHGGHGNEACNQTAPAVGRA